MRSHGSSSLLPLRTRSSRPHYTVVVRGSVDESETMYSDNDTVDDLIGFDDQVEDISAIVLNPSLLPVTVGLLGDWGSGKTSLLRMLASRLNAANAVVVEFSPWRIETYDDAKSALLDAVVTAVAEALPTPDTPGLATKAMATVRRLHKKVRWMRVAGLAAKHLITMTAPTLDELDGLLRDDGSGHDPVATTASVARDFHDEFRSLVADLNAPVIVLVDDLDRCLPEQVLDVLQAIRLFLAVPGTAFVLATDERVVRDAVRLRYPQATRASETDLPQEYLEKIVQIPIRIPPLGPAEIETYLNLLIAQKHCSSGDLHKLRARATELRSSHYLAVAMNIGIARECLGEQGLTSEAERDFELIGRTARLLSSGLKGNPRQVKRFLNMLLLRRVTANRRGLDIDDSVLTKLAVLEYTQVRHFQTLHRWQSQSDGYPPEIRRGEDIIAGRATETDFPDLAEWLTTPWLKSWLTMDPALADIDLNPYFVLARDALTGTAVSARSLPARLQRLVAELSSTSAAQRASACRKTRELEQSERQAVVEAGLERLPTVEDPGALALAIIDVVAEREDALRTVVGSLGALPYERISGALPAQLLTAAGGKTAPLLGQLLLTWENQTVSGKLSKAAAQVRRRIEDN